MYQIREGWTKRMRFQLSHDDLITDLGANTVTLVGRDGTGALVIIASPKIGIEGDGSTGVVYYDPDATDWTLAKSPLRLRFKFLVDGRYAFFPSDGPMVWVVQNP